MKDYTKLQNAYHKVVNPDWQDILEVELGDVKQLDKFYPQLKIKRWDNEVNASFRLKGFDNFTSKREDNKLKLDIYCQISLNHCPIQLKYQFS